MNTVTRNIRELVTAIASVVASFGVASDDQVTTSAAAVTAVAMLVWAIVEGQSHAVASFLRKALQALPPVLISFGIINLEQGAMVTVLLLAVASFWTNNENKQ